jgi:hypothetical protein
MTRDDFEVHDHIAETWCQLPAPLLDPPLEERMHQGRITEVAQGEEFRREVLEVHGTPGQARQRLIDALARGGPLSDRVGGPGWTTPLASLMEEGVIES